MSDASTSKLIGMYFQNAAPSLFMSSVFIARPENFHNSMDVELDIIRHGEEVAVVQSDVNGHHMNTFDNATNKRFTPPILKEAFAVRAMDLLTREPGDDPFADSGFQVKLMKRILRDMPAVEQLIRRSIELQASQILQTGKVDLMGADGTIAFTLDYGMRASHKITAGTAWNLAGGTPLSDIETACDVVRDDGLQDADELWMGTDAFNAFVGNADVRELLDIRRIDMGRVVEQRPTSSGGKYRGTIEVANYKMDIYTYNGRYNETGTGTKKQYLSPENVVVRSSNGRMDATFGSIPKIKKNNDVVRFLPRRFSGANIDMHTSAWTDNAGETLTVGVGARPLLIPTALDTFANIDTGV